MEYAKILVGKHEGKTLFIKSILEEDIILVRLDGLDWEYQAGEYEFVDMYGRGK